MLIEVREVNKTYATRSGDVVKALADVTLQVDEGEFVSVVGPSGCGKSTLLKILAGLVSLETGEARIRQEPVRGPRRDLGVVFQEARLLPWLTVLENVLVPARVQNLPAAQSRSRAQGLLQLAGLSDFAQKYPNELSGGMQQRVSIARSMIHDPSILLMDEPFSALDAMTREHMNVELLRIWSASRKTVFFITHSVSEAVFLSDRVIVMTARPGRIQEELTIDLPRPRTLAMMASPEFASLTGHLRSVFEAKGVGP